MMSLRWLLAFVLFLPLVVLAETIEQPAVAADPAVTDNDAHVLTLYEPNFLITTWTSDYAFNESMFQVSGKYRFPSTQLHLAYTQLSFWQMWDRDASRPFRETNYRPEFFYRFIQGDNNLGFTQFTMPFGLDIGFMHESNGQPIPESRSWNRYYIRPYWKNDRHFIALQLWNRVPEGNKKSPDDPKGDDNPDILDYYGFGALNYQHTFPETGVLINTLARANLREGKGAFQLQISQRLLKRFNIMAHVFSGYGESLIDYNRHVTRYGLGFALSL
ncbi:MAG: phospholipase A [Pseudomonadota bacterium]|nr:phospholipase A [Pseudomonadota bacterium]